MSDYETTQRMRNITVGVFVTTAICALIWLVFKFGDLPLVVSEWKSFKVKVQFPSAPGVQENTPVRFCGYQIGRVTDVKPPTILEDFKTHQFYHQTVVILSIDRQYDNIPSDVEVKLMTRGLGSNYIELKSSPPEPNQVVIEFLSNISLLQGTTGMTSEFFPEESQKKLEELVNGLSTLIKNANEILGDQANKENIKTSLANISEASKQATEAIKEFHKFSAAWINTGEELSKVASQLRVTLDKINNGQGTAARLINDGRLYENLLENTEQLQILLEELTSFKADFFNKLDKGLNIKLK